MLLLRNCLFDLLFLPINIPNFLWPVYVSKLSMSPLTIYRSTQKNTQTAMARYVIDEFVICAYVFEPQIRWLVSVRHN